jgi:hypothetical protein
MTDEDFSNWRTPSLPSNAETLGRYRDYSGGSKSFGYRSILPSWARAIRQ